MAFKGGFGVKLHGLGLGDYGRHKDLRNSGALYMILILQGDAHDSNTSVTPTYAETDALSGK